ncbi:S9 family peptidase [Sandaracinobacteroides saxicola]|uniref:S9 family peptidase n=2 Tax=Sandaracinobacteroides saxicola TaxID=2759707 RepID=A0A7G5IMG3_9SPHN|nr:S9 family peptidase [Sandaracinobacteroides saxicola]
MLLLAAPLVAAPRPVLDFAALPFMERPLLSPDGKRVAAKIAVQGEQYLAVVELGGKNIAKARINDYSVDWWRWVNNEWLALGASDMIKVMGEDFGVSRAMRVSADMKTIAWLNGRSGGQNGADLVWRAGDGSARVMIAMQTSIWSSDAGFYPEVREYDLTTGRSTLRQRSREGIWEWGADAAGVLRIGIGATLDGRVQRMMYRATADETLRTVDRARSRERETLTVPLLFLPDEQAVTIADDDKGFSTVFEMNLKDLTLGKALDRSPGYDVAGLWVDDRASKLLGVRLEETHGWTRWVDPALAETQAAIDKAVAPRRARVISMSDDRRLLLVHLGLPSEPGRYMLFDAASGTLKQFAWVNEAIRKGLHPVSSIRYKARDGLEIEAILTLPAGREAKALPLIVMPHGGPFARDLEEWDWIAQFLADRGYAVVQPNYRGSSGYGTAFARKGEGQWGLAMQDDLNDAMRHLVATGVADARRVCMVGASYGGYAAMRAAQRDGALYRCAASYAGVSDLNRMIRYNSRFLGSGAGEDWLRTQAPDLKAVSPLNFPEAFSIPLLLVHGAKDVRVPVAQSRQMAARLKESGKAVTYIEQPEADHHFSRQADRLQFLEALEAFLKEHNPA